jgi:uncharacterized protein YbaR (Trm112 family)
MAETSAPVFDQTQLDRLACPACLGRFSLVGESLRCAACGLAYPIVDGIPVLMAKWKPDSEEMEHDLCGSG